MPSENETATTSLSLQDLARALDIEAPEVQVTITGLGTIEAAGPSEITFLANDRYAPRLKESRAGAALVHQDFEGDAPMPLLRTAEPRLAFARLLALFHPPAARPTGIHPSAVVPATCTLGEGVSIGAYTVLGEDVHIGARTVIRSQCALYDGVRIGEDCEVHSHVVVREQVVLGDRVTVHNGSVLGADGFGFEPDAKGHLQRVPQVGTVIIGDDVDIQAVVCIDRAALGATRIGDGTKIDNLTQIAHGCDIGKHVVICGQVGLAGSTTVGNHVVLGGGVGSTGHVSIGDRTQVAARGGVMSDLPPDGRFAGVPAIPLKEALRAALYIPKTPMMARSIKDLEKRLAKLEAERDAT